MYQRILKEETDPTLLIDDRMSVRRLTREFVVLRVYSIVDALRELDASGFWAN